MDHVKISKNQWMRKMSDVESSLHIDVDLSTIVEKELPINRKITKNNTTNFQYFGNKNNGNLLPENTKVFF